MMSELSIPAVGRAHSALDDARHLGALVLALLARGAAVDLTASSNGSVDSYG